MHALSIVLASLLISAAPAAVPVGKFQTWSAYQRHPLDFASGGLNVHVEAVPCSQPPATQSESCQFDHYNNQAIITVGGRGLAPATMLTDPQSSYARIAVVQFDRHDRRRGVIVESQHGGSGGVLTLQLLLPTDRGFRAVSLSDYAGSYLEGQLADAPHDLSGDGRIDLVLADGAFDSVFGCNACTPRPPLILTVKDGNIVDESRDPALQSIFAAGMTRLAPRCLSDQPDRNGACAAYVADAARAGQFEAAWAAMLRHYQHDIDLWQPCSMPVTAYANHRCPDDKVIRFRDFPDSLRAFLVRTGYLPVDRPAATSRPPLTR